MEVMYGGVIWIDFTIQDRFKILHIRNNTRPTKQRLRKNSKYRLVYLGARVGKSIDEYSWLHQFRDALPRKWTAHRTELLQCTQTHRGNISLALGGKQPSDDQNWTPNLEAVRASIRFTIATGRLEATSTYRRT